MEPLPEVVLLPDVLDAIASQDGQRQYAEVPKSQDLSQGFDRITFSQLANAVNGIATILDSNVWFQSHQVIAYMAPNSHFTTVCWLACMKLGKQIFFISERNSTPAQVNLLETTGCHLLLTTDDTYTPVETVIQACAQLRVLVLPSWPELCSTAYKHYVWRKDELNFKRDISFITQSSGTTGLPKPVRHTYQSVNKIIRSLSLPDPPGYRTLSSLVRGKRCITFLPLNYPGGIVVGILLAIYHNVPIILPPIGSPPTVDTLSEILNFTAAEWSAVAPITLESLVEDSDITENILMKLSMLLFGGGSLPEPIGNRISHRIRLVSGLGAAETGPLPTIYRDEFDWANDWSYVQVHPASSAFFDSQADGLSELVLRETVEFGNCETVSSAIGHVQEYRTRDIFVRHPTLDGLWKHVARSDDIIVLSIGLKVAPFQYESVIAADPNVTAALLFGNGRPELSLLVQLTYESSMHQDGPEVRKQVWKSISHANHILPDFARVSESHVIYVGTEKGICRTPKGSIRRQETLGRFRDEIDELYRLADKSDPGLHEGLMSDSDIYGLVRNAVCYVLTGHDIDPGKDFFTIGMKSLQVLRLVRHINRQARFVGFKPSLVYKNPTIDKLSVALASSRRSQGNARSRKSQYMQIVDSRDRWLNHLTTNLGNMSAKEGASKIIQDRKVIVLTGSSGFVGRHILESLVHDRDTAHVYCLNRSSGIHITHHKPSRSDESNVLSISDKVSHLYCELEETSSLGLPSRVYASLCREVTHVIHAGWPVDFNRPLEYFEGALKSLNNLLRFCEAATCLTTFTFISSISCTILSPTPVKEVSAKHLEACPDFGYAMSKWIAESLIEEASQLPGMGRCRIIRLGQVVGSSVGTDIWPVKDWIPAMIVSSSHIGAIPDKLGAASLPDSRFCRWLPVDIAARAVVELACATMSQVKPVTFFHILNPRPTAWEELLPEIVAFVNCHTTSSTASGQMEVVTPSEWLQRLKDSSSSESQDIEQLDKALETNPALKLEEYFEWLMTPTPIREDGGTGYVAHWSTAVAETVSSALRDAPAITRQNIRHWLAEWFPRPSDSRS